MLLSLKQDAVMTYINYIETVPTVSFTEFHVQYHRIILRIGQRYKVSYICLVINNYISQ